MESPNSLRRERDQPHGTNAAPAIARRVGIGKHVYANLAGDMKRQAEAIIDAMHATGLNVLQSHERGEGRSCRRSLRSPRWAPA
jgi:hypothetical protein